MKNIQKIAKEILANTQLNRIVNDMSRKPLTLKQLKTLEVYKLDQKIVDEIKKLPTAKAEEMWGSGFNKFKNQNITKDFITPPPAQWFIMQIGGGEELLVNTEGYDYARYMAYLEGMEVLFEPDDPARSRYDIEEPSRK